MQCKTNSQIQSKPDAAAGPAPPPCLLFSYQSKREPGQERARDPFSNPKLISSAWQTMHVLEHVPPRLGTEWGPCFSVSHGRKGHTLQLAASKLLAEWGPFVVFRKFIIHIIMLVRSCLLKGNCEWAANSISLLSGG